MPNTSSMSRYDRAPKFFGKGRTKFDLSHVVNTTGNTGDLIVTLCEPVVPGSTMSLKTAHLTRLLTSLHQTLDNAYVETAYFFVPSRQLWTNFDKYQGYNRDAWAQTQEFKKPQYYLAWLTDTIGETPSGFDDRILPQSLIQDLYAPATKVPSLLIDQANKPVDSNVLHVDQLPLRAVFKTYNEYFRDQNYDSEIYYDDGDKPAGVGGSMVDPNSSMYGFYDYEWLFNSNYFQPAQGRLKVNRFKDVFSTALPQPQKGDPISVLLADSAPVGIFPSSTTVLTSNVYTGFASGTSFVDGVFSQEKSVSGAASPVIADLSGVNFTVNDLRIAIALQSMRERDAISGNRLNEKLYGTWHIKTNSLELDRAEYLGGKRVPVNMIEVLQTSETSSTSVLGSDAGHSKTYDAEDSFVRTFTQWGYVLGFIWVRTSRSYSQGIDRKFFVQDILDEYDPMLDNISEQPVYKKELNAVYDSLSTYDVAAMNKVFGYQEAWYQFKERCNRYTGMFQPHISGTLDSWHYGDDYTDLNNHSAEPFASPAWLKEDASRVDRTIAVAASAGIASFQWQFNIAFDLTNTFEASAHSRPNTFGF